MAKASTKKTVSKKKVESKNTHKKVFTKWVNVALSTNTDEPYLYIVAKNGDMVFINLIKDNKKYNPSWLDDFIDKRLKIEYTSYAKEDGSLTLFNVNVVSKGYKSSTDVTDEDLPF